ncbi:MAG: class I SAM-dependent methyltransferase [Leptolyngbyaceae cyanobacterium T60_A2020_046]|nr:class I SAM-dependent methyltransferase [Leptolyngbyaceae cyanobacterium T60_A2020_046]
MHTAMTISSKPAWAGDDWLSRGVNLLIRTKPLYALMKRQARQVLIKTAEKKGIPWRESAAALAESGIQTRLAALTNPAVEYPDYYRVPFHAYAEGNLCWQAAFEAESATYSMALRVWPQEDLTWEAAQARLRGSFHEALAAHGPVTVRNILDVGCSVGISTRSLHQFYQHRQETAVSTIGLDLSPYMLAVAEYRDRDRTIAEWRHARAESTGFEAESFDLVTLQFVTHELPRTAAIAIFQEAWRILRPGGAIAITDNNPQSTVIQNLPPVLFTLMKSTEPWSDDYYTFNLEAALMQVGFGTPITTETDPRHRAIIAHKAVSTANA